MLLDDSDRFYSADVPEGRIMSQVPAAGEQVRSGWRVRVAESMGPQRVVIPDLVGESERAAEINIRRRGLEMGTAAIATISGATRGRDRGPESTGECDQCFVAKAEYSGGIDGRSKVVRHARSARPQ